MKKSDKIYLAVLAVTAFFITSLLTGCKSTKHTDCDAYGSYQINEDSTIVKVEHCHIEEDFQNYWN